MITKTQRDLLQRVTGRQPFPLLFVTVSGAHLYGFPSRDSDFDLRGVHVLPVEKVVGLDTKQETIEFSGEEEGLEMDLVTHDVRKFIKLMLKKNGYVLEQLFSPLVLLSSRGHGRLKELGAECITRHHSHHYLGFAETQWRLFEKESPKRAKTLLYVYRVLLTGIHLMRTGRIEANLVTLNAEFRLPYISDLIAQKTRSAERSQALALDLSFHETEYRRLCELLESEAAKTSLPETPRSSEALNDFLVSLRTNPGRFLPANLGETGGK